MVDALFLIGAPVILVGMVYLVILGTVRFTKGGGAGTAWVGLGLLLQWMYWATNHAPYFPLLIPSPFILVLFFFTGAGIWMLARTRTTGAWKWALLGLVPVVGSLFAGFRLLLMPVTRPRRPSFGRLALTVLPGVMLCVFTGLEGMNRSHPDQAVEAPNEKARVLVTSAAVVGYPLKRLEWQRLAGPFIIETRSLHTIPHYLWNWDALHSAPFVRWSSDSSRILVTGVHRQVNESPKLHTDIESAPAKEAFGHYVLYDAENDRLSCNAADGCKTFSPFSDEDVKNIHWVPTLATYPSERLNFQSGLKMAIDMPGRTADEHLKRGLLYLKKRQYEEGMKDLNQAREMEPTRIDIYRQIDNVLTERREWDAVISMWTKLISLQPTNGQAYYERGGASFHKGDMPTALKDLEQACKYNYGDSCQRLQRFAQQ